jgi:hypothetical protein
MSSKKNKISISKLKSFCKLAKIEVDKNSFEKSGKSFEDQLKNKVKRYLLKYTYAPRYLRGLTPDEKFIKMFEIRYYKLKEKYGKISTSYALSKKEKYKVSSLDKPKKSKKSKNISKQNSISKYTKKWNKSYKAKSLKEKSKISGVPLPILKKVYNRGLAAWRGSSHRPGASQHQWGVSRVNSFLTCGKTWYYPDHKLSREAMSKSPKARTFWKKCNKSKQGKRTKSR